MGRWRLVSLMLINKMSKTPIYNRLFTPRNRMTASWDKDNHVVKVRAFGAVPSLAPPNSDEFVSGSSDFASDFAFGGSNTEEFDEESAKIPVKAYFLSTSINLKTMQAENHSNVLPPSSRSSNYIALRYSDFSPKITGFGVENTLSCCRYLVVFQYGSAVLFNIDDHEVETYLDIVRKHATGLLRETKKDDYAVIEKPLLAEDMQGGPDYIALRTLDTDSVRIIGSVLGQSIALDYFISQVDGMVEEFTGINRGMEETGTFTMERKKLFQLVGKANSNLADVILKVGLFDRSEIAWREAKYAQIYEYLREEYEVTQRFGNLDFKLTFVEHNIHFLQEVLQNRKSDLLEWCIIFLLTVENALAMYEIIRETAAASTIV